MHTSSHPQHDICICCCVACYEQKGRTDSDVEPPFWMDFVSVIQHHGSSRHPGQKLNSNQTSHGHCQHTLLGSPIKITCYYLVTP